MTGNRQSSGGRAVWKRSLVYCAVSAAVVAPCFWQRRIQAGDLSSHVYNAWLAQLIEQGQARGLMLAPQTHNILFDVVLGALLPAAGAGAAQRIAVSAAVLTFFWGVSAFVWTSAGGRGRAAPWRWAPCVAMLAYGWVYHMGLFNFYISLGLCFGALTMSHGGPLHRTAAAIVLALAYTAHPLPFAWALAAIAYGYAARRVAIRRRILLAGSALAGILFVGAAMRVLYAARRAPDQVLAFTGADQIWVFDNRYVPLAAAVLALWAMALRQVVAARGIRRVLLDIRVQLCALTAAAILLVPGIVRLPSSGQEESLLVGRMSLAVAVLVCAAAARAPVRREPAVAMAAVACIFFFFVYSDEEALNRVEDKMERTVAQVPAGQRVVSALMDPNRRLFSLLHVIDRACLGHCFSYANYEPSIGQFRVRAERENGIVVANFRESWAMQAGGYTVRSRDLPLYRVDLCGTASEALCIAPVRAGEVLKTTWLHITPGLWKEKRKAGS